MLRVARRNSADYFQATTVIAGRRARIIGEGGYIDIQGEESSYFNALWSTNQILARGVVPRWAP